MKKEITAISALVGITLGSAISSNIVNYQQGKVSDSRYLLAMSDEMKCGKEMKEKVKECKKMMKEASCGAKIKECKNILKSKESSCGAMINKTKDKAKEMACGQCGAMK